MKVPPAPSSAGQVGPVGGEYEHDVGVFGQAVHLVEQLEQHRVLPWIHAAFLGDEVDVFYDEHRGRECAPVDCVRRPPRRTSSSAMRSKHDKDSPVCLAMCD